MIAKNETNRFSLCYRKNSVKEKSWQYHVIGIQMHARILSVRIMLKRKNASEPVHPVERQRSLTLLAAPVVNMQEDKSL